MSQVPIVRYAYGSRLASDVIAAVTENSAWTLGNEDGIAIRMSKFRTGPTGEVHEGLIVSGKGVDGPIGLASTAPRSVTDERETKAVLAALKAVQAYLEFLLYGYGEYDSDRWIRRKIDSRHDQLNELLDDIMTLSGVEGPREVDPAERELKTIPGMVAEPVLTLSGPVAIPLEDRVQLPVTPDGELIHMRLVGSGEPIRFHAGELSDAAKEAFSAGQCGAFAYALSEATGWEIYVVVPEDKEHSSLEEGDGGSFLHAVVKTPDGRFIDINGTMTREQLIKGYSRNSADGPPRKAVLRKMKHEEVRLMMTGGFGVSVQRPRLPEARSLVVPRLHASGYEEKARECAQLLLARRKGAEQSPGVAETSFRPPVTADLRLEKVGFQQYMEKRLSTRVKLNDAAAAAALFNRLANGDNLSISPTRASVLMVQGAARLNADGLLGEDDIRRIGSAMTAFPPEHKEMQLWNSVRTQLTEPLAGRPIPETFNTTTFQATLGVNLS